MPFDDVVFNKGADFIQEPRPDHLGEQRRFRRFENHRDVQESRIRSVGGGWMGWIKTR